MKTCQFMYWKREGADQSAHLRRLISACSFQRKEVLTSYTIMKKNGVSISIFQLQCTTKELSFRK